MAAITYMAKRSVRPGRESGTTYTFDVPLAQWDRSPKRVANINTSLAGVNHTLLHRIDIFRDVATVPLGLDELSVREQMEEFLDSVSGGESFVVDVYGSVSNQVNPVSCELVGDYTQPGSVTIAYRFKVKTL